MINGEMLDVTWCKRLLDVNTNPAHPFKGLHWHSNTLWALNESAGFVITGQPDNGARCQDVDGNTPADVLAGILDVGEPDTWYGAIDLVDGYALARVLHALACLKRVQVELSTREGPDGTRRFYTTSTGASAPLGDVPADAKPYVGLRSDIHSAAEAMPFVADGKPCTIAVDAWEFAIALQHVDSKSGDASLILTGSNGIPEYMHILFAAAPDRHAILACTVVSQPRG